MAAVAFDQEVFFRRPVIVEHASGSFSVGVMDSDGAFDPLADFPDLKSAAKRAYWMDTPLVGLEDLFAMAALASGCSAKDAYGRAQEMMALKHG